MDRKILDTLAANRAGTLNEPASSHLKAVQAVMDNIGNKRKATVRDMKEVFIEAAFLNGFLRAWRLVKPLRAYDDDHEQNEIGVIFVSGSRETVVQSAEALRELVSEHGTSLQNEVTADPAKFAALYAILLNVDGRVVNDPSFWDFLDEGYGVSSADLTPRVEDGYLRFTTATIDLFHNETYLIHIRVNLHSGAIETKKSDIERKASYSAVAWPQDPSA